MASEPVCRGLLRQQAITNIVLLKGDAKAPKDGVIVSKTVGGLCATIKGQNSFSGILGCYFVHEASNVDDATGHTS